MSVCLTCRLPQLVQSKHGVDAIHSVAKLACQMLPVVQPSVKVLAAAFAFAQSSASLWFNPQSSCACLQVAALQQLCTMTGLLTSCDLLGYLLLQLQQLLTAEDMRPEVHEVYELLTLQTPIILTAHQTIWLQVYNACISTLQVLDLKDRLRDDEMECIVAAIRAKLRAPDVQDKVRAQDCLVAVMYHFAFSSMSRARALGNVYRQKSPC